MQLPKLVVVCTVQLPKPVVVCTVQLPKLVVVCSLQLPIKLLVPPPEKGVAQWPPQRIATSVILGILIPLLTIFTTTVTEYLYAV